MKTALITGISGQDGTYLAELLLANKYHVVGTTRDINKSERSLPRSLAGKVDLVEWNLLDQDKIVELISRYGPAEIYNLASYSSGAGMFEDPVRMGEINGLAVTRILEAIRVVNPQIHFCQASSREIFGAAPESPQSEKTSLSPRSPYGAAKLYASSMVQIYRRHYNLFACSAILFNHESPRRRLEFVTRKITHEAARIKIGQSAALHLGNLNTMRDWGFAGDYVRAMWMMLQKTTADDYVIATGKGHTVRNFCECAFTHLGLDYMQYVREESAAFRPSELTPLVGNVSKARIQLGWEPQVDFRHLVHMMVDADLLALTSQN